MTVDSEIFSISTLNTIEYGPLTLNIKTHLDPLYSYQLCQSTSYIWYLTLIITHL